MVMPVTKVFSIARSYMIHKLWFETCYNEEEKRKTKKREEYSHIA